MGNVTPICTIASKNALAQARSLAHSYREHHPDGQVFLCLVDTIDGYFDPAEAPFTIILAEQLHIPHWDAFSFQYTAVELNAAIKPFLLAHLMETYALDRLIYFDPDIVLYDSLARLDALLDHYGLILTPHILHPLAGDGAAFELGLLRTGVNNLGFAAISRRTDVNALLRWWQNRLLHYGKDNRERGMFHDQRWMDMAPAFFPNVHIWQSPAANLAWWNLSQRRIEGIDGHCWIDGEPLLFMNYSGLFVDTPESDARHDWVSSLAEHDPLFQTMLRDYRRQLLDNGYRIVSEWPYAYQTFANGVIIPNMARHFYWSIDPTWQHWPNPYAVGAESFFEFMNSRVSTIDHGMSSVPYLTPFIVFLYENSPDIRGRWPLGLTAQRAEILDWFHGEGKRRYNLDDCFLVPTRGAEEASARPSNPARGAPLTPLELASSVPAAYDRWNERRIEAVTLQGEMPGVGRLIRTVRHIPVVGTLLMVLKRALRLGTVWDAETQLYAALIAEQRLLQDYADALGGRANGLEISMTAQLDALERALRERLTSRHLTLAGRLKALISHPAHRAEQAR